MARVAAGSFPPIETTAPTIADLSEANRQQFINAGSDIESIFINENEVHDEVESLCSKLSRSSEWDVRAAALKRLMGLVNGGCLNYENFRKSLSFFIEGISLAIVDLRSALVKQSCLAVAQLSRELGSSFEQATDFILPLSSQLSHGTQIISESCFFAMLSIGKNCSSKKVLFAMIDLAKQKKSGVSQKKCVAACFVMMLQNWPNFALFEKNFENFSETLIFLLNDASSDVRSYARQAAKALMRLSPKRGNEIINDSRIDERTKKNILQNDNDEDLSLFDLNNDNVHIQRTHLTSASKPRITRPVSERNKKEKKNSNNIANIVQSINSNINSKISNHPTQNSYQRASCGKLPEISNVEEIELSHNVPANKRILVKPMKHLVMNEIIDDDHQVHDKSQVRSQQQPRRESRLPSLRKPQTPTEKIKNPSIENKVERKNVEKIEVKAKPAIKEKKERFKAYQHAKPMPEPPVSQEKIKEQVELQQKMHLYDHPPPQKSTKSNISKGAATKSEKSVVEKAPVQKESITSYVNNPKTPTSVQRLKTPTNSRPNPENNKIAKHEQKHETPKKQTKPTTNTNTNNNHINNAASKNTTKTYELLDGEEAEFLSSVKEAFLENDKSILSPSVLPKIAAGTMKCITHESPKISLPALSVLNDMINVSPQIFSRSLSKIVPLILTFSNNDDAISILKSLASHFGASLMQITLDSYQSQKKSLQYIILLSEVVDSINIKNKSEENILNDVDIEKQILAICFNYRSSGECQKQIRNIVQKMLLVNEEVVQTFRLKLSPVEGQEFESKYLKESIPIPRYNTQGFKKVVTDILNESDNTNWEMCKSEIFKQLKLAVSSKMKDSPKILKTIVDKYGIEGFDVLFSDMVKNEPFYQNIVDIVIQRNSFPIFASYIEQSFSSQNENEEKSDALKSKALSVLLRSISIKGDRKDEITKGFGILMPYMKDIISSNDVSLRQAAVQCLAQLKVVICDDADKFIAELNEPQQKLVSIYYNRIK